MAFTSALGSPRTEQFMIRVSTEELSAVASVCRERGVTRSDYVRGLIAEDVAKAPSSPSS